MTTTSQKPNTLLEAVRTSLAKARRYDPGDVVAPAAVLWTDADCQWQPVVEHLRGLIPELLTLGDYRAEKRTGPAIWLRCVIEPNVRKERFPGLKWPDDAVPVIYMPGVSRQTLRAVEECSDALKPLVELQYRGTVWTQKNGKDWTVRAFLVSEDGGLGLDVTEDKLTLQAMQGALSRLAVTPIARLRGNPSKRLEAEDFDRLMSGDTPRDLLLWLGNPEETRGEWDNGKWSAFCNRCRGDYGFDPETEGEIVGGEKLGLRKDAWYGVWERFSESPTLYPGIPDLLRRAKPRGELLFDKESWPDENDAMENALRAALADLGSLNPAEARRRLIELESEHGLRRGWTWERLGLSPLANAMEPLSTLAKQTMTTLGGDSVETMAKLYTGGGYVADDAALRAIACVKTAENLAAVKVAVRCVYLPWLEDSARHFQECLAVKNLPAVDQPEAAVDECILFADGLRFDLGQRFVGMAGESQLEVSAGWRWAALPTVTATAKPASSPVASRLRGERLNADFSPEIVDTGQRLDTERLRNLLTTAGFQVLGPGETGDPQAQNARGWTEYGEFDKLGHTLQGKLAARIEDQLDLLLERVHGLLAAGWKRVRVVTDHGWLLVPGGLPKVQLPKYLTESRWSRCASIKDSAHLEVPIAGWSWNPGERFAYGPGVHCFVAGHEYAHGGASLQECLIPVLTLSSTHSILNTVVTVREIQWVGLRCRVSVKPAAEGLLADLRTKPNVSSSSITEPKGFDAEGRAALLVADESLEGTTVSLVIIDASGRVVSKEATAVGGDV